MIDLSEVKSTVYTILIMFAGKNKSGSISFTQKSATCDTGVPAVTQTSTFPLKKLLQSKTIAFCVIELAHTIYHN